MSRFAGILLLLACPFLAACGSDAPSSGEPVSSSRAAATVTVPTVPAKAITDARQAVDADDYESAIAIIESSSDREARSVRRRIANRLASRALTALDVGKRGRARRLVAETADYPSTERARAARASLAAADAQAVEARRRTTRQQRLDRAMRQAQRTAPPRTMQRMAPPTAMEQMAPPP
ncbi:MAG: hypothetical protein M3376_07255 [Actinomycetota bacterium]|nr:hypothetical protein [Actinomycetota bacterium]